MSDRRTRDPGAAGRSFSPREGISHYYGSLAALQDVNIEVKRGEVVGLVGDNGAGKSTLLKILCGAVRPTEGALFIDGEEVVVPLTARVARQGDRGRLPGSRPRNRAVGRGEHLPRAGDSPARLRREADAGARPARDGQGGRQCALRRWASGSRMFARGRAPLRRRAPGGRGGPRGDMGPEGAPARRADRRAGRRRAAQDRGAGPPGEEAGRRRDPRQPQPAPGVTSSATGCTSCSTAGSPGCCPGGGDARGARALDHRGRGRERPGHPRGGRRGRAPAPEE